MADGHIHPVFEQFLQRGDKERQLKQRAKVIWLTGLSGSGKTTIAVGLEQALHAVLAGDSIYEAFQPHGRSCGYNSGSLDLTPREFEVLLSLARGLSNKQIETALTISSSTLKTHLRSLFDKFAVSNRTACLVSARHAGFL